MAKVHCRRRRRAGWLPGAVGFGGIAVLGAGGAATAAEGPSRAEMMEQLNALRSRLEVLQANEREQQAAPDAAAQAADDRVVDQTVADVIRDADQRPRALQLEGFTAGYDGNRFLIQSADGKYVLHPNVQLQLRYVANHRDGGSAGGEDAWSNGLELRRLRLVLDGNLWSKNFTYKVQWGTNRTGGALVLEEAWAQYRFDDDFLGGRLAGFGVRAGQFKDPTFHEEITSARRQLAVDRSLTNELIGGGQTKYEQGVSLFYSADAYRGEIGYFDGASTANTNFQDGGGAPSVGLGTANFGAFARAEHKVTGDWKQYDDFTALGNRQGLLVVGGGVNWLDADDGYALFHTADVQWEPTDLPGLNVYAAYLGVLRHEGDAAPGAAENLYDWGFLVQGGYLIARDWEVFARYDYTRLDNDAPGGPGTLGGGAQIQDSVHEVTVGVNHYWHGHAAKLTLDVSWLPNGSPINADGIGVLAQPDDEDQFVLRAQLQLLL